MAARFFVGKITPTAEPLSFAPAGRHGKPSKFQKYFSKDALNLQSTLLGGALLQLSLCILLPTKWAIVPAAAILLSCLASSAVQQSSSRPPPSPASYLDDVVVGRATAQLPSPSTGQLGPAAADKPICVFHLGVQWNHRLGAGCPGAAEVIKYFFAMNADLLRRREELGLLALSKWNGGEDPERPGRSILTTYYFKDAASIHSFAHEELHRRAWEWYNGSKMSHIGVFHETFSVPAHSYETMYANCSPILMGRSVDKCETEEGARWVNALVSADTPLLKTQNGRMGRDAHGNIKS